MAALTAGKVAGSFEPERPVPNMLEERVRRALASTIRIIAKIGEGGMGVVYKGRHLQLDVDVAVKVLRPELAESEMEERFRREAQLMARFNHPHITQVLDLPSPDQVDGLHLFVMQYIEGSSLAEKLTAERLGSDQAWLLGIQLLDALAEVHRRRVVHRDVKPANLVFDTIRNGWVLVDFGIARVLDTPTLAEPGTAPGTVEYLPPEKDEWRNVTPHLDLYAAAATIFESYTAEAWNKNTSPTSTGWGRIPGRQARSLRRGIAPARTRWGSADEFRKAFRPRWKAWWFVAAAAVLAAVTVVIYRPGRPSIPLPSPVQMALVPFTTGSPTLQAKVADLYQSTRDGLNAVLDTDPAILSSCDGHLEVQRCVTGEVDLLSADSFNVTVTIRSPGRVEHATLPPGPDPAALGRRLVTALLAQAGHQDIIEECRLPLTPTDNVLNACAEYHDGLRAFQEDSWPEARRHFRRALELNPVLTDALWRAYTTDVWRREDPGDSLVAIIKHHRRDLSDMDGSLFDAQTAPQGATRIAMFERVIRRFPKEALPSLLYGSELFHRGALNGIQLDSSAAVLREAVAADPQLAEAYDQLLWVLIRLGNRAATDSVLAAYPPNHRGDLFYALAVARAVRFDPEQAMATLNDLDSGAASSRHILRQTFRFGPSLDIPLGEMALGRRYSSSSDPVTRADGLEGMAIAELIMGMVEPGLAHVDSAARGEAGALEAAEWRVILSDLGVLRLSNQERERGRVVLRSIARSTSGSAARAAWALAVDAYRSGDPKAGATWQAILESQTAHDTVPRLSGLLKAVRAGASRQYGEALRLSRPSLDVDEAPQIVDPFFRTVLHLERARWAMEIGDSALARHELLWSENADIQGWSTGPAQAAEVDWVAGSYARVMRARLNRCQGLARADTILAAADVSRFPAVDSAKACRS